MKRPPSEFKSIFFKTQTQSNAALCILNSTLFYWFITIFSDCRHLNKREVDSFPIKLEKLSKGSDGTKFNQFAVELMKDITANSESKVLRFRHDTLTVQCIYPRFSKQIIDKIDTLLASHYGFTPDELDFIINYDIKYRLGADNNDE